MKKVVHVVSMSGGKDSTATAILALEQHEQDALRFVFADTGNEHELTLEYVYDYLPRALGVRIDTVRADFIEAWEHRRQWLMSDEPRRGNARRPARSEADIARVLRVFEQGPTGNPYLDLCIVKGRFPSRRAQFCTQVLKVEPITDYQLTLIDAGHAQAVWSWQGIRLDESEARRTRLQGTGACVRGFEESGGGMYVYRPILRWTAQDCFAAHRLAGVAPNPLYRMAMERVGCMPCVNCSKAEIREIAARFPKHIDRIREWEAAVRVASWRGEASFFPSPDDNRGALMGRGIDDVVRWSGTTRGGRQFDLLAQADEPLACASSYGLCE